MVNNFSKIFLVFACLLLLISCEKDAGLEDPIMPTSILSIQEAKEWLKEHKPNIKLGSNWDNAIILRPGNGDEIIKVRLSDSLVNEKVWILSDFLFHKKEDGNLDIRIYKVVVDDLYLSKKNKPNIIILDKRNLIDDSDFTGQIYLYTVNNEFIKGRRFVEGKPLYELELTDKHKGSVMTAPPIYSESDWNNGGSSGGSGGGGIDLNEVIIYGPAPTYPWIFPPRTPNSGGSYDVPIGGSGGGGGGGGGGAVPSIVIAFNGNKVDPKKETKCFNKMQSATMTIYVQQPNANTRDMNGQNSVGHAFIGITQNGITRNLGFYPNSPTAAVFGSQTSEVHDNSGEMYHVSISKVISAVQLSQVINYINNYPSTYSLSTYNCTDFAIGVAQQGGLSLPATTGTTTQFGLTFSGRNPGDLGQDLRKANLPSGVTRTTNQTNAPAKSGNCP